MSQALYSGRRVLWMPFEARWAPPGETTAVCCDAMRTALAFDCTEHADPFECGDGLLVHNPVFGETGLVIHDGGASYVLIAHCPWCGAKLPDSERERWFDETEAIEKEGREIPPEYFTAVWRTR